MPVDGRDVYKQLWNSEYRFRPTRAFVAKAFLFFAFLAITSAAWFLSLFITCSREHSGNIPIQYLMSDNTLSSFTSCSRVLIILVSSRLPPSNQKYLHPLVQMFCSAYIKTWASPSRLELTPRTSAETEVKIWTLFTLS